MKRHGFLIIGMACLIGFVLTLAAIARAETTVAAELIGQGAGYDLFLTAEAQTIRFLQAGEREQDTIFTVGLGWEF